MYRLLYWIGRPAVSVAHDHVHINCVSLTKKMTQRKLKICGCLVPEAPTRIIVTVQLCMRESDEESDFRI